MGPENAFSRELHAEKYRADGESFDDYCVRYARAVTKGEDDPHFFRHLLDALRDMRILPAGRQQLAVGRPFQTTAFNCFVMGEIPDSLAGIFDCLKESAMTLRAGGGIGMDFSTLRPAKDPVRGLGAGAEASGPVSFMETWNAMSRTIQSADARPGAMMGVLRVDHPDIERFVRAKSDQETLKFFNVSVAVTDDFMQAVECDGLFKLRFGDTTYGDIRALDLWAEIMEQTWDWAEPGVIFIDTVNRMNPLAYCERIAASNPCAEQMLPPYGACLLGSLNLVKYLVPAATVGGPYELDWELFDADARAAVRAFDRVIDVTVYPLEAQAREARAKRRMGIGLTGVANALEVLGHPYGTPAYIEMQSKVLERLRDSVLFESCQLAQRRGAFPAFKAEEWLASGFGKTLPEGHWEMIRRFGLRNGQLLSIAPTGTISMTADNVSSGIEPVFAHEVMRKVRMAGGEVLIEHNDYAFARFGHRGRQAHEVSPAEHVAVLAAAQRYVDAAVSKTVNVRGVKAGQAPGPGEISFDQFKDVYRDAWAAGCKGLTTYRSGGKKEGILAARSEEPGPAPACFIDERGVRECA